MDRKLAALLFATLLLVSSGASAATRWVTTTGGGTTCSQAAPCQTISAAHTAATAGDTVNVVSGNYKSIMTGAFFTNKQNIIYRCTDVNGNLARGTCFIGSESLVGQYWENDSGGTTIDGFDCSGAHMTLCLYHSPDNANPSVIQYNKVHDIATDTACGAGAGGIYGDSYHTSNVGPIYAVVNMFNNTVYNVGNFSCGLIYTQHGIYAGTGGTISNNISYHNKSHGIESWHDGCALTIVNNDVFANGSTGIHVGSAEGYRTPQCSFVGRVNNNISINNGIGILVGGGGQVTTAQEYANNLLFNNSIDNFLNNSGVTATCTNCVTSGLPTFTNYTLSGTGDFSLVAGSRGIDQGTTSNAPAIDIIGTARPQGTAFDIGAYEFAGASACVTAANPTWVNNSITAQTGIFTLDFDVTPSGVIDGSIGPSNGAAAAFTDLAAIVSFLSEGQPDGQNRVQVRNGGSYTADVTFFYTSGLTYHIRMTINISTHTYSVYITPPAGATQTLATNYAFRTEQAAVATLNNVGMDVDIGTSMQVCNITVASGSPPPTVSGSVIHADMVANISSTLATNPTGIASVGTDKMFGLSSQGGTQIPAFTPKNSGVVLFNISGNAVNSGASQGLRGQIRYGTGTAPVNGATATGTVCGSEQTLTLGGTTAQQFSLQCIAAGLTMGTPYWFDLAGSALVGGTGTPSNITATAAEF